MTDLQDLLEQKPITKPPGKWVNWRRALVEGVTQHTNHRFSAGDVFPGAFVWPSKEIAEQKALEDLEHDYKRFGRHCVEYLGAFPEGETPE